MNFKRHRRLRKNSLMRDLVRETTLSVNDFIQPLFVKENLEQKEEVASSRCLSICVNRSFRRGGILCATWD